MKCSESYISYFGGDACPEWKPKPKVKTNSFYNIRILSTVKGPKWANVEKLELINPHAGRATVVFLGFKLFGLKVLFGHKRFNQ